MSTKSKVEKFIDALRNRILSGEFGSEGRLPSFRTLAIEYSTTQETMNKTMQTLQAEGLLTSKGSKGVFVTSTSTRLHSFAPNFFNYIKEKNPEAIEEYIETPTIIKLSTEISQKLGLKDNSEAIKRFKRQRTGDVVFRLEEIYYPIKFLNSNMKKNIIENPSYVPLDDIKSNFNIEPTQANDKIVARLPSVYEQEILKIVRTNPVIDIKRTLFSKSRKEGISYQHLICNANLFFLSYDFDLSN